MKKWIIGITIGVLILSSIGFYLYSNNSGNNNSNYEAERTSTNKETENNTKSDETKNAEEAQKQAEDQAQTQARVSEEQAQAQAEAEQVTREPTEDEELAAFSTKIYTKDSSRQNNITITCSALNDTDVSDGETFSFCDTVGRASPSKGYQKADIFKNGEKIKGYGGGNCQVSTTLYNAVLEAPGLNVTERHEHSNKVPYIQNGKDAAVAYGRYDFKFVNNTGNSIRIKAENDANSVTIRLINLK